MSLTTYLLLLSGAAVPLAASFVGAAAASERYRISTPVTHENLTIYFVHGPSASGPVPLTLKEALLKGGLDVHETGNVNQLFVENRGDEEVFIQAGDIVKGGRQDRVLTVSLVVPPKSGRVPIGAYCVEQGRWSARGRENVQKFSSAESAVPSRDAKMALYAPPKAAYAPTAGPEAARTAYEAARSASERLASEGTASDAERATRTREAARRLEAARAALEEAERASSQLAAETSTRQRVVWDSVAASQRKLSRSLEENVAARLSASSLQLSLENEKLISARAAYVNALQAAGEKDADVVGFVFAVNGKLNSADVYPSNGLFRKMWPKLLEASAIEAIGEKGGKIDTPPNSVAVQAFFAAAEKGKVTVTDLNAGLARAAHEAETALAVETRRHSGGFVHRSYVAK